MGHIEYFHRPWKGSDWSWKLLYVMLALSILAGGTCLVAKAIEFLRALSTF